MKKIAVLLCIILLITRPLSAQAGSLDDDQAPGFDLGGVREDVEIEDCLISAYGVENTRTTIYTFAKSDHLPDDSLRMRLLINGDPAQGQGDGDGYVQPTRYDSYIKDSGAVTRYLVLIDCSTSMPAYKADIQAFVRSLIETNNSKDCDAAYTIAGCGTQMEVFGQADMTDLNKVMDVLNTVDYGQQGTDFGALEYNQLCAAIQGFTASTTVFSADHSTVTETDANNRQKVTVFSRDANGNRVATETLKNADNSVIGTKTTTFDNANRTITEEVQL